MRGGGGVLSFEIEGTGEQARAFAEALQLFALAPSLGGVDSLVTIPALTSHGMISPEHRRKMGVSDQLIRLAVGIESADDLIADLAQALVLAASSAQPVAIG
jgi:cystathionine beta-lyase/cystathionine gamma-synthase